MSLKLSRKNILYGYLYIFGGIFFIGVMAFMIFRGNSAPTSRHYMEMLLVVIVGICCMFVGVKQIIDHKALLGGVPKGDMEKLLSSMEMFKSLDISVQEIAELIDSGKEEYIKCNPIIIYANDVTGVLDKYRNEKINERDLLIWCNMISFSKCFYFYPDRADELEGVVTDIRRKLDRNGKLTMKEIDEYILVLIHETEI